jgi:hypothetical protein
VVTAGPGPGDPRGASVTIMPPHCDSLDGPVVTAARHALVTHDVERVLPYVPAEPEPAVRDAFDRTSAVRVLGAEAEAVADRWFFETVVRIHRAGEAAAFTGLKPAGLDVGPVIPAAERALTEDSPGDLVDVLCSEIRDQVTRRLTHALTLKEQAADGVPEARAYV